MDYKTDFKHKILYKLTVGYVIECHAYTVSKMHPYTECFYKI